MSAPEEIQAEINRLIERASKLNEVLENSYREERMFRAAQKGAQRAYSDEAARIKAENAVGQHRHDPRSFQERLAEAESFEEKRTALDDRWAELENEHQANRRSISRGSQKAVDEAVTNVKSADNYASKRAALDKAWEALNKANQGGS